ncbi:MAG: 50S ribosomal protein L25 [bacterium]
MSKVQINVKPRDPKLNPRALVREETIPGVIYDQKTNSESVLLSLGELEQFLVNAKQGQLVELTVDGKNPRTAVFKELQMDVRTNSPKHVSFMLLAEDVEVDMPVRIKLEGLAPAVKNSLGVLIQTLNAVNLRGLPKDFPNFLTIDVSSLQNVGDTLGMNSISIPEGLDFIRDEDKDLSVVTISPFQKAIEEEKPEIAEGEEGEEGEELAEGEEAVEGEEGETPAEGEATESEEGETPAEKKPKE